MARKFRIQYHVMNRGDRRESIFHDDADRQRFIETLGEACGKTGWQVHAYCLMPNHFHLVLQTPQPNLVAGMKWFLGTYTGRFNRRHKLFGHLFSGRYKALIVDSATPGYLKTACDYVHLNPVRARLLVNGSVPAIHQFPLDTCSGGRNSGDGMARKIRIQYPGAVYHVMNRGDQRESIFHDDDDRQRFIETLGEACGKTGWQVHAYCLMPNHFHLVLETPQPNLVAGMKWFLGTYTGRFNRRHKLFGRLFSGRYK